MSMDRRAHWNRVYAGKTPEGVTWYQPHLEVSLRILHSLALPRTARVLDVGGGASTFVRDLLDEGFRNITLLDISPVALELAGALLGERIDAVCRIEGDVTAVELPQGSVDLWHDRAVYHFLTEPAEREAYVAAATRALATGGHLILGGFAPTGPTKCSGLDVVRGGAEAVAGDFGDRFVLVESTAETHVTPSGASQDFIWVVLRRLPEPAATATQAPPV